MSDCLCMTQLEISLILQRPLICCPMYSFLSKPTLQTSKKKGTIYVLLKEHLLLFTEFSTRLLAQLLKYEIF